MIGLGAQKIDNIIDLVMNLIKRGLNHCAKRKRISTLTSYNLLYLDSYYKTGNENPCGSRLLTK